MKKDKLLNYLIILLLCLISFAVYANSLFGEFLIDDFAGILNNNSIHNLKQYLTKHFYLHSGVLTELVRAFLWNISGGTTFYFHLFNVLVHAACSALLFILCNILFNNIRLSFLSSLIFAIHPIHTEVVSWISGGPYTLSSLFFLLALIFYIKSDTSILKLAWAVVFFGLCLFTANPVVSLPVIFIVYDLFFKRKSHTSNFLIRFRQLVLFILLVVSAAMIGIFFVGRNKFIHTIFYFKGSSYLVVVLKALTYYLKIMYLPVRRGLYHPFAYNTVDTNKISPAFFGGLIVILVSIILFFRCRKNHKPLSFGIAWFFVTYLPYSNFIPICNIISERYVYLPSVGFCIFLAYLFLKVWEIINQNDKYKKALRIIGMLALVLFLLSYTILTVKHNFDYKDIVSYWESNINNFPDGYMAYNNLAGTYYAMGDIEQAIAYSWVNLMINPKQPHVWCNLGKVYREKGNLDMSTFCYEEALKVDKGFLPACHALEEIRKLKAVNKK